MSYSTRNAQSSPVREERRQTNDACYWCRSNIRIINRGTILNESTSGALLRTPQLPNVGETILMLPILWEDTSKPLSYKQIREHPLTRLGSVVRRESTNSVGIRYDDEQEGRPQFRRWFRGEAEITTLFNSEQGMLRMKGVVGIEAAALIQSILRQDIQVKSLIVVATEIENIAPTSVTIIRSALQQCESSGVHVHCVYSGKLSRSGHGLLKHEERSISNSATYTLDTPVGEESTETHI